MSLLVELQLAGLWDREMTLSDTIAPSGARLQGKSPQPASGQLFSKHTDGQVKFQPRYGRNRINGGPEMLHMLIFPSGYGINFGGNVA